MPNPRIEILGAGCPKCQKTAELFKRAAEELGVDAEIVHVTDVNAIIDRGVMFTPAVFINGKKVVEGKVPNMPQAQEILKKNT